MPGKRTVGVPQKVQLGKLGTFLLHPHSLGDMEQLQAAAETWALRKAQDRIKQAEATGPLSEAGRLAILQKTWDAIDAGLADQQYLLQFEGLSMLVWLSVRQGRNDVTLEQVQAQVQFKDVNELRQKMDLADGLETDPPKPSAGKRSNPKADGNE